MKAINKRQTSIACNTQVFTSIAEYAYWREKLNTTNDERQLLGLVPTMGALHAGHLALIRQAVKECDQVVVYIFVNPLQFGPAEDFDKYPRCLEKDLEICQQEGVQVVFQPQAAEIYQGGSSDTTKVIPPASLDNKLCSIFRPGFFVGVSTVLAKMFSLVRPDVAYFGEKDYQQLLIVRRMVLDLYLPLEIRAVPTVREADGLAASSRNLLLSASQRQLAPKLYETLCFVRDQAFSGKLTLKEALAAGAEKLSYVSGLTLQYLEACHADTLETLTVAQKPLVILIAAKLGDVRLIDNLIVR